jgi:hypothetical protein
VGRRQEPGPFARFDLDVALALVARLTRDFGATVVDVDGDGNDVLYMMEMPAWGRSQARRGELIARNRRQVFAIREHCREVREHVLATHDEQRSLVERMRRLPVPRPELEG